MIVEAEHAGHADLHMCRVLRTIEVNEKSSRMLTRLFVNSDICRV